ncbi:hypothetical protein P152DRAFT_460729, partial [Eremomyces bilateralis CBS 781.70]
MSSVKPQTKTRIATSDVRDLMVANLRYRTQTTSLRSNPTINIPASRDIYYQVAVTTHRSAREPREWMRMRVVHSSWLFPLQSSLFNLHERHQASQQRLGTMSSIMNNVARFQTFAPSLAHVTRRSRFDPPCLLFSDLQESGGSKMRERRIKESKM